MRPLYIVNKLFTTFYDINHSLELFLVENFNVPPRSKIIWEIFGESRILKRIRKYLNIDHKNNFNNLEMTLTILTLSQPARTYLCT